VIQKIKEIGIRKVNGARLTDILISLNRDFIRCFAVAFIIACPATWYLMNKWLQGFVYRISLEWWVFAAAGITVLAVTVITSSILSIKAAIRNPIETLRYE
jgi:putative ABC transport system permease protein